MLAERADKIIRQLVAFVDISAHRAYEALLALGIRLWLYIALVIGVGHGLYIGDNARLSYGADKHSVCVKIYILLYLKRHECIDISWKEYKAVIGAQGLAAGKFIYVSSALEAKILEYLKRSLC